VRDQVSHPYNTTAKLTDFCRILTMVC
jgi:hypothetical protein